MLTISNIVDPDQTSRLVPILLLQRQFDLGLHCSALLIQFTNKEIESQCCQNHMAAETYKYTCIRRIAKIEDHGQSASVTVPLGGCMRFLIFVVNAYSIIIFVTLRVKESEKNLMKLANS